jgi:hypothetical protein
MITLFLSYALPILVAYHLLKNYFTLRSIPGPLLARFTNIYRAILVYNRSPHETQLTLHEQYGNFVRLGPNVVTVTGSSTYVPQIYGIGKGLVKSDFYACFQNIVNGRRAASLVAMTDESQHAKSKRQIAHAYSLSTLVEYEELVNRTVEVFLNVLDQRFATTGTVLDLGRYLQFFAFDVIGELTFSHRLGFIEQGEDVDDIIKAIGANFQYFSVLGQVPWLDEAVLGKNPIYVRYFRKSVSSPILLFAQKLLKDRLEDAEKGETEESEAAFDKPDFLSRFLKLRHEAEREEETLTDAQILSNLFVRPSSDGPEPVFKRALLKVCADEYQRRIRYNCLHPPCNLLPSAQESQLTGQTAIRTGVRREIRRNFNTLPILVPNTMPTSISRRCDQRGPPSEPCPFVTTRANCPSRRTEPET